MSAPFFVAPDAGGDLCVWRTNRARPDFILRRSAVPGDFWSWLEDRLTGAPPVPVVDTAATPADSTDPLDVAVADVAFYKNRLARVRRELLAAQVRADDLAARLDVQTRLAEDESAKKKVATRNADAAEARATATEAAHRAMIEEDRRHARLWVETVFERDAARAQVAAVRALVSDEYCDPYCARIQSSVPDETCDCLRGRIFAALDSAGTPAALDPQPAETPHPFRRDKTADMLTERGHPVDGDWCTAPAPGRGACGQRREHPVHDVPTPPAEGGGR